jgi:phage gpG-like protein
MKRLAKAFDSQAVLKAFEEIPRMKGTLALIAQAIRGNFNAEGPGWKALKGQTIRQSLSKKLRGELRGMSAKQIEALEEALRKSGESPYRKILRRTSLLFRSVTTPGAAHQVSEARGLKLVYGTDLVYAGVHNYGMTIQHPGTNRGFGIPGLKIKPHPIRIPKREFLKLGPDAVADLQEFVLQKAGELVKREILKGNV